MFSPRKPSFQQLLSCRTNPVTNSIGWPLQTGQDFIPNHAVSTIDFASIHFWPDNWGRTDLDFGKSWMTTHINQSDIVLKKPLIIEEFGKAFGGNPIPYCEELQQILLSCLVRQPALSAAIESQLN